MLLGGKGGCQQCTCVPCNPCERTCTNPHTGTAFEAVYTRYFEGAEDGNVSDGYLTASGDSDTSDPYDGMDGNGPWFQQVAGEFTLDPSTTRHPCGVTVSFWRNNYVLGASTIPPPATTTTMNRIRVSVSALSGTGVFVEGTYVAIGDTLDLAVTIPLVTGGADQSTNDPRTSAGTATVTPECHNKTAIFTISGRIEWNVSKRQHVVYGLVRECYEEGTPCGTACDGNPSPDVLYLTISNFTSNFNDIFGPLVGYYLIDSEINGTYILERPPYVCDSYSGVFGDRCLYSKTQLIAVGGFFGSGLGFNYNFPNSGCFFPFIMRINYNDYDHPLCGPNYYANGTSTDVDYFANGGSLTGSFDWVLES